MKQILVLQNQRIGDTLQTTPLLMGLREKYDPCHITLVASQMFADLNLDGLVDEVIHFNQNDLFQLFSDPRRSVVEKYDQARRFLEPFRSRHFDLVVDVPADVHMHLLASTLENAGEVRGALLSPARNLAYSHPEVMLLYTIGLCREVNRFNLVDLYNALAGVRPRQKRLHMPVPPGAREFAVKLLAESGVDPRSDRVIALQPGASEERKRWGDTHFARLSRLLVERLQARVVLCGSASERPLGERISREAGIPVISAMGHTTIAELAALLGQSRVLVTNDTGTMHVAAAVGTPIIDISVGPVFFRETGPYAEGSLVVEANLECSPCNFNAMCHHFECRDRITPEMIFRLVDMILANANESHLQPQDFHGVKIHKALFNDIGRLEFVPVFRYPLSYYQFLGFFYAHTWEVYYGLRRTPRSSGDILNEIDRLHDLEKSSAIIHKELERGLDEFSRLESELRAAATVLRPLSPQNRGVASPKQWEKGIDDLQNIYQKLLVFGRTRPAIRHFTAFLELAIESQAGAEATAAVGKINEYIRFVLRQVTFLKGQLVDAAAYLEK